MKSPGKNTKFAIGMLLGAAIGVATHNIALWLPLGLMWGLLLSYILGGGTKDNTEKEEK